MIAFLYAVFGFIVTNYIPVLAVYTGGGILYAAANWLFRILKLRSLVKGVTDLEQRKSAAYKAMGNYVYPPQVGQNKGRLFGWAVFWPIHLPYTMLHDVASEAFSYVYRKFGAALQKLTNSLLPE